MYTIKPSADVVAKQIRSIDKCKSRPRNCRSIYAVGYRYSATTFLNLELHHSLCRAHTLLECKNSSYASI